MSCSQGGPICQPLRTEPHLGAWPGQPPQHGLLVTQGTDEAPGDGSGLAAQWAGDGPGVILHVQQQLQADSTESMLAAQELWWPGTAVGLPAHQALQVAICGATMTPSGALGVGGGGFFGEKLGLLQKPSAGHSGYGGHWDAAAQGLNIDRECPLLSVGRGCGLTSGWASQVFFSFSSSAVWLHSPRAAQLVSWLTLSLQLLLFLSLKPRVNQ